MQSSTTGTLDGTPASEARNYVGPLGVMRKLFGATPAREFGPRSLNMVLDEMIVMGWSRKRSLRKLNMHGWMSPNFGPIGCTGAIIFFVVIVVVILSMLYLPWSLVIHQP